MSNWCDLEIYCDDTHNGTITILYTNAETGRIGTKYLQLPYLCWGVLCLPCLFCTWPPWSPWWFCSLPMKVHKTTLSIQWESWIQISLMEEANVHTVSDQKMCSRSLIRRSGWCDGWLLLGYIGWEEEWHLVVESIWRHQSRCWGSHVSHPCGPLTPDLICSHWAIKVWTICHAGWIA